MSNEKPIRIVWGTPAVPGGRWLAGLLNLKLVPRSNREIAERASALQAYSRHRLHLSLRGVLIWCLSLVASAYFAGTAVVLHRIESRTPHNRVGYLDLTLPWRWKNLERLRGEALIATGREALAAGRFQEGLGLLRAGLARHPADADARLLLARLHLRMRLTPRAIAVLLQGLDHGYPGRESLETLFTLLRDSDRADKLADACLQTRQNLLALAESKRRAPDARWLDQQTVRALIAVGRTPEAVSVVENHYTESDPFRREFTVAHLLDTDRTDEAIALARVWAGEMPGAAEPLRLLVVAARQKGDHALMDETLLRLHRLNPTQTDPLVYALVQNQLAGRPDAAGASLDQLLLRHGADPALYASLAPVLTEIGFIEGLDRLELECAERGLSPRPVLWARLEMVHNVRAWTEAERLAAALEATPGPAFPPARQIWLRTVTHLARACLDGSSGTQSALVETISDNPGSLSLYVRILEALLAAGRPATARDVLVLAEGPYPDARALRDFRPRLDTALAAAADAALQAAPLQVAKHSDALDSLDAFVAAFNARVENQDAPGALALLAEARRARPDWLAPAAARLENLELPLHARGDDPLRLQFLARTVLARDPRAPDYLLSLAQDIHLAGHEAHARLLVKEIVRAQPGHDPSLAQLRAWTPDAKSANAAAPQLTLQQIN